MNLLSRVLALALYVTVLVVGGCAALPKPQSQQSPGWAKETFERAEERSR